MKELSRRDFLKGAAAIAATGAAGSLLGATAFADEPNSIAWDEEFDVIIVGAGLAGLATAITIAREGNGEKCLLIEKGAFPGGNSPYSLGAVIMSDDKETVKSYLEKLIGECTPEDVIDAYAGGLTENLDWIKELGAKEDDLLFMFYDSKAQAEYPEIDGGDALGFFMFTGAAGGHKHIYNFLMDKMKEYPDVIDYRTATPMESLVQDASDKSILGVAAGGKHFRASKAVVMCCGGFESDKEMLQDYTGVKGYPYAGPLNTGDGHRACMKIGADFWHMHSGAQYWMGIRDLSNTRFLSLVWNFTSKQYGITIGTNGRRFYQDYDGCKLYGSDATEDMRVNVGYRHGVTQFGGSWSHLPMPEKAWFIYDSEGLSAGAIPAEKSADPVADGWALKADTIEELAAMIDVPIDELVQTVETWNSFCVGGKDLAFYRPADTLQKIETGPFYASLCVPAMLNTDGGPRRSAKGEILDPDGKAIPNLYSAGEFGSIWGHFYEGAGNLAECMIFGRIAARSIING